MEDEGDPRDVIRETETATRHPQLEPRLRHPRPLQKRQKEDSCRDLKRSLWYGVKDSAADLSHCKKRNPRNGNRNGDL